jgi:hypothetical protein
MPSCIRQFVLGGNVTKSTKRTNLNDRTVCERGTILGNIGERRCLLEVASSYVLFRS